MIATNDPYNDDHTAIYDKETIAAQNIPQPQAILESVGGDPIPDTYLGFMEEAGVVRSFVIYRIHKCLTRRDRECVFKGDYIGNIGELTLLGPNYYKIPNMGCHMCNAVPFPKLANIDPEYMAAGGTTIRFSTRMRRTPRVLRK